MKAIIAAIIILLIFSSPIDCQKFVDSDNTWNIADCSQSGPECWTYRYKFDEDSTLIRGKYYHELLRSQKEFGNNWNSTSDYMREDNNQVWYIDNRHPMIETLMYDFNLLAGDTVFLNNDFGIKIRLKVETIDSVKYGNILRKRIVIHSISNVRYKMTWVEGIGDIEFWLGSKWVEVLDGGDGWLLCHDYKDETIFKVKRHEDCWYTRTSTDDNNILKSISVYPNPAADILKLNTSVRIESVSLYDQFGRRMLAFSQFDEMNISMLNSGIYYVAIKTIQANIYYDKIIKL